MTTTVEVLTFRGCPHAESTLQLVRQTVRRLLPEVDVVHHEVSTPEEGESVGLLGSPTVRINGEDLEGRTEQAMGLACRIYPGHGGVPPQWMIEAAILRALQPRHILFLCVQNSARSQMAEGIARNLAPPGVRISSAGSEPSAVRPEAAGVLLEIGVDISSHHAKGMAEVEAATVEAVVTLCAEQICPVFLSSVHRIHWGLEDPARISDSAAARLTAFRQVRDEFQRRLKLLFRPH